MAHTLVEISKEEAGADSQMDMIMTHVTGQTALDYARGNIPQNDNIVRNLELKYTPKLVSEVNGIKIRPLCREDYESWSGLWKNYLAFYKTELSREIYQSTFNRMLSGLDNEFHGLVVEKDGELVGLAHFLFHRTGWSVENSCYLQDLFVSEKCRGLGLGKKLIQAVYEKADECLGKKSGDSNAYVYWMTQESNSTARKLYDQIGKKSEFIIYERNCDH
jgi:GNAT superfamily N-acetyltransferase